MSVDSPCEQVALLTSLKTVFHPRSSNSWAVGLQMPSSFTFAKILSLFRRCFTQHVDLSFPFSSISLISRAFLDFRSFKLRVLSVLSLVALFLFSFLFSCFYFLVSIFSQCFLLEQKLPSLFSLSIISSSPHINFFHLQKKKKKNFLDSCTQSEIIHLGRLSWP
jgi:hypothetical protein